MHRKIYIAALAIITMSLSLAAQTLPVDNVSQSLPCLEKNFNIRVVMTVDSASRQPLLSRAQVDQLLEDASHFFSPICISFTACDFEVIPNYSYAVIKREDRRQEMGVVYHYPRRITLFIVDELDQPCGYSELNGLNSRNNAQIYIARSCPDGLPEQYAHHMGTLLGLLDTNNDAGSELADGSNCDTAGDMLCDTPADPFGMVLDTLTNQWGEIADTLLNTYTQDCEFVWLGVDINRDFFNPLTTNIISPYSCKCSFTREQFLKMVENYDSTEYLKY